MDRSKAVLIGAAIIVLGVVAYKKLTRNTYQPIVFMGAAYLHVADANQGGVVGRRNKTTRQR